MATIPPSWSFPDPGFSNMGRKEVDPALPLGHSEDNLTRLQPSRTPSVWHLYSFLRAPRGGTKFNLNTLHPSWSLHLPQLWCGTYFSLAGKSLFLSIQIAGIGVGKELGGHLFHDTSILRRQLTGSRLCLPFFPQTLCYGHRGWLGGAMAPIQKEIKSPQIRSNTPLAPKEKLEDSMFPFQLQNQCIKTKCFPVYEQYTIRKYDEKKSQ